MAAVRTAPDCDTSPGASALRWAESKLKQIERQSFAIQDEEERIITGALMLADTPIYRNDGNGEYYVVFSKDTIKKIAQKYFKKGYQNNVNLMHDSGQVMDGITMFESWIVDENRGIKPMKGFEAGAKWQAERMYSEEDMEEYAQYYWQAGINNRYVNSLTPKEWFEQFKKK